MFDFEYAHDKALWAETVTAAVTRGFAHALPQRF
jgi:hypothetical protein